MSERGVFAVDRGIWTDADFADEAFSEREAFLWMLSEAAWRPTRVRIGAHAVDLARGQLAFSTRFMAAKWKWSEARVRRYLGRLISAEIVCTTTDKIATHVTILKYDRFQRVSLPDSEAATHERRTSDAPSTHLRRKEEDRENKEITSLRSVDAKPAKVRAKPKTAIEENTQPTDRMLQDARDEGMDLDEIRIEWRAFRDNSLKHGNKYSDWPAAWRTWIRSEYRKERSARRVRGSPAFGQRLSGPTAATLARKQNRDSHDEPALDLEPVLRPFPARRSAEAPTPAGRDDWQAGGDQGRPFEGGLGAVFDIGSRRAHG